VKVTGFHYWKDGGYEQKEPIKEGIVAKDRIRLDFKDGGHLTIRPNSRDEHKFEGVYLYGGINGEFSGYITRNEKLRSFSLLGIYRDQNGDEGEWRFEFKWAP